jgi:hypothetical protein
MNRPCSQCKEITEDLYSKEGETIRVICSVCRRHKVTLSTDEYFEELRPALMEHLAQKMGLPAPGGNSQ